MTNLVMYCRIKQAYKTNHSIVELVINFINLNKGSGCFKLISSLLLENESVINIKNSIKEINENSNPRTTWELIKASIHKQTIKYATYN